MKNIILVLIAFSTMVGLSGSAGAANKKEVILKSPIVVYEREGLLTPAEKKEIQEKLLTPFFAHANKKELDTIVVVISVPAKIGDDFEVLAISKNGSHDGFTYSKRGAPTLWHPEAVGQD